MPLYCFLGYLPKKEKNMYVYIKTGAQMFREALVGMARE